MENAAQTTVNKEIETARPDIVLSVRNLRKKVGKRWIIKGISFDIAKGEIFGFLGPNGSGKTTTIRMLVDLIRPTEGTVTIGGHDLAKARSKALAQVGAIVENPEMYPFLTGRENLRQMARMRIGIAEARISEVVDMVGLSNRIDDKVKTYSLGMRQRLGIAQALLADPRLLILDEPTNGLDPQGIRDLRLFLRQLADRGISLLVSSHLLSEIEMMCDRVAIIGNGETIAVAKVSSLLEQAGHRAVFKVGDAQAAAAILAEADIPIETEGNGGHDGEHEGESDGATGMLTARVPESDIPRIIRLLHEAGIALYGVTPRKPTLEELFLDLTGGGTIG